MKKVAILGATGSIGTQTAEVILKNRALYKTVLLTCHKNKEELARLGEKLSCTRLVCTKAPAFRGSLTKYLSEEEIDVAVVAASGIDILPCLYALIKRGDVTIALANKECVVAAGKILMEEAKRSKAKIVPVDSEHSAIFQCLAANDKRQAEKIILTASGGAFRNLSKAELARVTVRQALQHPNWKMGKKITIDSATMMNKGLELIEARFLFDIPSEKLSAVIHPESIVHSLVEYRDGSVLGQLALADMRIPISYALGYPKRIKSGVKPLDFKKAVSLNFYPIERGRYPCFELAESVLRRGKQSEMAVLAAADEYAVNSFLKGRIAFTEIADKIEEALSKHHFSEPNTIEDVLETMYNVQCTMRGRFQRSQRNLSKRVFI